ncbi:MAG: hypothetical protein OEY85_10260, partial [Rhodospirillales bacterium]|nr:hypothetical protein [Rhodospirillales bacterium]
MKKTKRNSTKRNRPRRRVTPFWRRRSTRVGAAIIAVVVSIGGVLHLWQSGSFNRAGDHIKWKMVAVSESLGFTVNDILVVGRKETSKKNLRDAV